MKMTELAELEDFLLSSYPKKNATGEFLKSNDSSTLDSKLQSKSQGPEPSKILETISKRARNSDSDDALQIVARPTKKRRTKKTQSNAIKAEPSKALASSSSSQEEDEHYSSDDVIRQRYD